MYWDALNDFEGRSLWWQRPDIQPKSWNMDTRFAACGMSATDNYTLSQCRCAFPTNRKWSRPAWRFHPFRIFPVGKIQSFLPIIAACLCYLLSMLVNCQHCILQRIWWNRLEMEMIPSQANHLPNIQRIFHFEFCVQIQPSPYNRQKKWQDIACLQSSSTYHNHSRRDPHIGHTRRLGATKVVLGRITLASMESQLAWTVHTPHTCCIRTLNVNGKSTWLAG